MQASYIPPIKSDRMLYCLSRVGPGLAKLCGQGKEYEPLIPLILTINPEARRLPTGKVLQEQLSITPSKFRKWLEGLHSDFFALIADDATVLDFPTIEHWIQVVGKHEAINFRCRLPVTPRIGEGIELWFLYGVAGTGNFYVDDVRYECEGANVLVILTLRVGSSDPYRQHLRARARFEGKLGYELELELGEYRVADYLRQLYPGSKEPAPVPTREVNWARKRRY